MSILVDLARLQTSRDRIRAKLVSLGLVSDTAKLDVCATAVEGIANNVKVEKVLTTTEKSYVIPRGFHDGTSTVSIVTETKEITPSKSAQTVTPSTGKLLSSVSIKAIPNNFIDTTDATAVAENILKDKTAYIKSTGTDGSVIPIKTTGTMPNNGAVKATIDGIVTTSYIIAKGFHDGTGTVSLTSDIETALASV